MNVLKFLLEQNTTFELKLGYKVCRITIFLVIMGLPLHILLKRVGWIVFSCAAGCYITYFEGLIKDILKERENSTSDKHSDNWGSKISLLVYFRSSSSFFYDSCGVCASRRNPSSFFILTVRKNY